VFERGTENHVIEQEQASLLLYQSALREHLEAEGMREVEVRRDLEDKEEERGKGIRRDTS